MMKKLSQLRQQLAELTIQATELDSKSGARQQPLFDELLFHNPTRRLAACSSEAQETLERLILGQETKSLSQEQAQYLTERFIAQLTAIQRVVSAASHVVPKSEDDSVPTQTLYLDLAQHQEWEDRLALLVMEKQTALERANYLIRQQAQQELALAEQRLLRCQTAKAKIEQQITLQEKGQ